MSVREEWEIISGKSRSTLRLRKKFALPDKGLRPGIGNQVLSDGSVDDEEHESSTEDFLPLDAQYLKVTTTKNLESSLSSTEGDSEFIDPSSIDPTEMEHICSAVLPTALHHPSTESKSYALYIKEILELSSDKFDELYEKVEYKEKTELHLLCKVKGAKHLQPKDSKSLPDMICHLTIFPSCKMANPSLFSMNVMDWLENGIVSSMKKTSFASSTLSPLWNQSFQLSLKDPPREMIVAEIWGKKNKPSQSKKPKEYYEKPDNFIGRAFYLLKSTPIDGEDRTLTLYSHSSKHERGTIDLHLTIKGQQEDVPVNVSMREHTLLLKLIINHETKTSSGYVEGWDGRLSEKAEIILMKHTELSGISSVQEKCIHFNVFLEYHKLHSVKMFVLAEVVEEIVSVDPPITNEQKDEIWVKQLLFDMHALHIMLLKQLNKHLTKYDLKTTCDMKEITSMIKTLKILFLFPPFMSKLEESKRDLKASVEICIQVAVPSWFLELSKSMLKDRCDTITSETGEMHLITVKGLCIHCLKHCQRALKLLNPIFESVSVDYFSTFYVVLDKLLSGEVIPCLQALMEICDDQQLYELYIVLKDLSKLSAHVDQ